MMDETGKVQQRAYFLGFGGIFRHRRQKNSGFFLNANRRNIKYDLGCEQRTKQPLHLNQRDA